jgi:hypothetical protein
MHIRSGLLLAVIAICAVLGHGPAFAQAPGDARAVTPPSENGPVDVTAGVYVIDISDISETDNTFQAEIDVIAFWNDPRLAFDAETEGTDRQVYIGAASERFRTRIWNAQGSAANAVGRWESINQKITIFADGRIMTEIRLAAKLRAVLDFARFPFDTQVLPVHIESFAWNRDVVRIKPFPEQTGFDPSFQLAEWTVKDVSTTVTEITRPRDPVPYSRLTCNITIDRKTGFYLWKIFLPLLVIVAISWVVFWMNREMLGRRAGVSVTGILTVIAYQFVVSEALPRVSYLTVLDKVLLLSTLTIAATLLESLIVEAVQSRGGDSTRVDRACRWAFPLVYFSILAFVVLR